MNRQSQRIFLLFGMFVLMGGLIITSIKSSPSVEAQSSGADCRDTNATASNVGSPITLTYAQARYATTPEKIFDTDANSSGKISVGQNKDFAYVAAKLPKRMAITKVDLNWSAETGGSAPGSGWNLYTGLGPTIPQNAASFSCFIGQMSQIGLTADGVSRSYNTSAKPFKADYIVLTQAIAPNSNPTSALISDLKVYGIEAQATPPARLKIKTILKGSSTDPLPVSRVTVYDLSLDEKNPIELGRTDDNGELLLDNLQTPYPNRLQVGGDDEIAAIKRNISLDPKPKENVATFEVAPADDNSVGGIITDTSGTPQGGVIVTAIDANSQIVGLDTTDSNGVYRIVGLPKGTYSIRTTDGTKTSNAAFTAQAATGKNFQSVASSFKEMPNGTVEMKNQRGGKVRRDAKIAATPKKALKVKISTLVQDQKGLLIPNPGMSVTIKKNEVGDDKVVAKTNITQGMDAKVVEVPSGCFIMDAKGPSKDYIQPQTTTGCVFDSSIFGAQDPDASVTISLRKLRTISDSICIQKPQTVVKDFWACGESGLSVMNNAGNGILWTTIDTAVNDFRQKYKLTNAPVQIRIGQITEVNSNAPALAPALFDFLQGRNNSLTQNPGGCPWKSDIDFPARSEMIVFNPREFNSPGQAQFARNIVWHELGHVWSWRSGQCRLQVTNGINRFTINYKILSMRYPNQLNNALALGAGFYKNIPNPEEGWAEAFMVGNLHQDEFNQKIKSYPPEAQKMLQLLVKDASSTAPVPYL